MFSDIRKSARQFLGPRTIRLLVIGGRGSGKSSAVGSLQFKGHITTIPTKGYSIHTFAHGDVVLQMCDVGQGLSHALVPASFVRRAKGVVLVVDSTNRGLLPHARSLLTHYLELSETRLPLVLVMVNKCDVADSDCMDETEVALGLNMGWKSTKWCVERTSALTGEGIEKGIEWIVDHA